MTLHSDGLEADYLAGVPALLEGCPGTPQAIHQALNSTADTPVLRQVAQDLAGLIGKPYGDEVRQSEAVRKLREALLINPYITSVDQVSATFEGSWLHVSFSLHTIYGEVSVRDAAIGI